MASKQKCAHIALGAFVVLGLLGVASISWAQADTWTTKTPMPTPRVALSACVVDGKIYAIGGGRAIFGSPFATVEVYDPATDTWTTRTPMPTARMGISTSVVDGKIYAIGGNIGARIDTSVVEAYDPATDTWTRKADMPTARFTPSTCVVDGKIYAIGGEAWLPEGNTPVPTVDMYDPATDTWTQKADMSKARALAGASVVNGKIYVIGGAAHAGRAGFKSAEAYDPLTDTWTSKANMPTARWGLSASVVDGKIYAIGGSWYGWDFTSSTVEVYDPATDTWTTSPRMPTPRSVLSTCVVDGKIYAIGGDTDGYAWSGIPTVEVYDVAAALDMERLQEGLVSTPETFGATKVGQSTTLNLTVELPVPLEETELLPQMSLDLSPLGISSDLPLEHAGADRYTANTTVTPLRHGRHDLPILVETPEGDRYPLHRTALTVYPEGDLSIYDDAPAEGWTVETPKATAQSDPTSSAFVRTGNSSHAILLTPSFMKGEVTYVFEDPMGMDSFGCTHLAFYIHGGGASGQDPKVAGTKLSDLGIEVQSDRWTWVSIPLSGVLDEEGRLTSILFSGTVKETFYIDDMKLVAVALPVEEVYLYRDEMAPGWELKPLKAETDPNATDYVHSGSYAHAITLQARGWVDYIVEELYGLPIIGYEALEFWINPGSASIEELKVMAAAYDRSSQTLSLVEQRGLSFEPAQWQQISIPLADLELTDAYLTRIRLTGDVEGTFYIDDMRLVPEAVPEVPTAVEMSEGEVVPSGYSLSQNHPNPFNPETTIRYDLPEAGAVRMCIYNVSGQRIRTLADGESSAGNHSVTWDGRNDAGRDVASGVYLCRLAAGEFSALRKLVLVR